MPELRPKRRWQVIEKEAWDWTGCLHVEHAGRVCQGFRWVLLDDWPGLKDVPGLVNGAVIRPDPEQESFCRSRDCPV